LDLIFQYDRNTNIEQAPFSANSGFYFAKYNQRTNYYFSMLARMGDLILKTGSHQQVMSILMSDHIATHGLRVKVMGGHDRDGDLFPSKFIPCLRIICTPIHCMDAFADASFLFFL
jgi:hypothetical protein